MIRLLPQWPGDLSGQIRYDQIPPTVTRGLGCAEHDWLSLSGHVLSPQGLGSCLHVLGFGGGGILSGGGPAHRDVISDYPDPRQDSQACSAAKSGPPCTVAHQAPLSMGFSRQEYWNGLPCPPLGDLPDPGIEPTSPAWQADSLPLSHLGSLRQDPHIIFSLPCKLLLLYKCVTIVLWFSFLWLKTVLLQDCFIF